MFQKREYNSSGIFADKAISSCKTNMYTAVLWMRKALMINLNLCQMCASLQDNLHCFNSCNTVELCNMQNLRCLHSANYVCSNIDPLEYPHLIKRHSDMWNDLICQSYFTDYNALDSIGFNGVKCMRQHYRKFILETSNCQREYTKDFIQSEIDGFSTIANIMMSALLPSCAVLYEEGCCYFNSKKKIYIMQYPSRIHQVNQIRIN